MTATVLFFKAIVPAHERSGPHGTVHVDQYVTRAPSAAPERKHPRVKEFRATPDVLALAVEETKASAYEDDISIDMRGVIVGALRRLDRRITMGDMTLADVAKGWDRTRALIRQKCGDTCILWRADAPRREHNSGTLTQYFASQKMAERYNSATRTAKPYLVKTDDIIAVPATERNYYEVIVKRPPFGFVPLRPSEYAERR